jgi:hypothetical protein
MSAGAVNGWGPATLAWWDSRDAQRLVSFERRPTFWPPTTLRVCDSNCFYLYQGLKAARIPENRQRGPLLQQAGVDRGHGSGGSELVWLSLAVTRNRSDRPWTKVNLAGRLWTPANGFEDRGANVRGRPLETAIVRSSEAAIRDRPPSSAVIRRLGCLLGCQRTPR